jgi:hypothetical protein
MFKAGPVYSNDFGDRPPLFTFPPKNPKFEALDRVAVERRVRRVSSVLKDDLYPLVSQAVIAIVPPPKEMGGYLSQAVSGLEGIREFLGSSVPDGGSFDRLCELVSNSIEVFEILRDRFLRTCAHKRLVVVDADFRFCRECREWFRLRPGETEPGRLLTLRAAMPKGKRRGARHAGRPFFIYFITELLRRYELERGDAIDLANRLCEAFWSDKEPPYSADDGQLEDAYKQGQRTAKRARLATVDEFVNCPPAPRSIPDAEEKRVRKERRRQFRRDIGFSTKGRLPADLRSLEEFACRSPAPGIFEDLLIWVPLRKSPPEEGSVRMKVHRGALH